VAAQQAALNFGLGEILRMKISARNVLAGTVKKVTKGAVNAEVVLALKEGDTMTAIITNHSVDSLGLREGNSAYAIIKASEVMVGKNVEGAKLSARNVLAGEVARLEPGAVNSEVEIRLPGGTAVVASITKASVSALDLQQGDKVSAIIKASHVLVGL
jgi:molybdate transport system regulatory protein